MGDLERSESFKRDLPEQGTVRESRHARGLAGSVRLALARLEAAADVPNGLKRRVRALAMVLSVLPHVGVPRFLFASSGVSEAVAMANAAPRHHNPVSWLMRCWQVRCQRARPQA